MDNLKKKIKYEFIMICTCIIIFTLYIMGLAILNIYFSDFLLAMIQVILVGTILIFIIPLHFHDLEIANKKSEVEENTETTTNVTKPFWNYCITVSLIVAIISTTIFLILWILAFLLNLTSPMLNVIGTVLGFIMLISFFIVIIIIFIRCYREIIKRNRRES